MEWVLLISLAVLMYCLVSILLGMFYRRSLAVQTRLDELEHSQEAAPTTDGLKKAKPKKRRSIIFVSNNLRNSLNLAAIKMQPEEFVSMWIVAAVVPAFLFYSITQSAGRSILIALVGTLLPPIYVTQAIKKRQVAFEKQLGDSLQVLSNALRVGFSFQQALDKLSRDFPDPLGREFQIASREMLFGVSTQTVLSRIAERMQSADMTLLTAAVVIQQDVGGNLADILDTISKTIRDRQTIRRTIRTLTAQGRISGLIIGALPIVLLVAISFLSPGYTSMFFTTLIGKIMLIVAAVMEFIGFMVIRKIIDIKF